MCLILYFTSVSLSSVSFIFAGGFLLGDGFGSLVGAGWTCSELIAHHVPYTFTAWDHRCSGIEGWKLFSYTSLQSRWCCASHWTSSTSGLCHLWPHSQAKFWRNVQGHVFRHFRSQRFYNLLLVFFVNWLYFTTFRCLRWSFSRPWTRVFLSSIVLELQAAEGCALQHKQFAFGSMWDFEILESHLKFRDDF